MRYQHIDNSNLCMGNKQVFTRIYRLYFGSLCYFSFRFVGDDADAEDIVEEVFTKLWQQSKCFNNEEHLKAYLYQAIHHASLNLLRSKAHAQERQFKFATEIPDTEESYQHNIIRSEIYGDIYRAVMELPAQSGKVIRLAYLEGMKNEEIALEMGLSVQTVKNYKLNALKILKGKLSKEVFQLLLLLPYLHFFDLLQKN